MFEKMGQIVIRKDTEEEEAGSSRCKVFNTGPSVQKKGISEVSDGQLKSI